MMPTQDHAAPLTERTCIAAGLFARMADCIDRGLSVEAIEAHRRLATLGYNVSFRPARPRRRSRNRSAATA